MSPNGTPLRLLHRAAIEGGDAVYHLLLKDVLQFDFTDKNGFDRRVTTDGLIDGLREADPSRLRKRLQPRGNINAVTEQVLTPDD